MENVNTEMLQINELAVNYEAIRSVYEELNTKLEEIKKEKDQAEKALMLAILDAAEKTGVDDLKVKVENRSYGVKQKDYFTIPKADRDEAFRLLRELGHGDLITERVDDRTLSKEMGEVIALYRENNPDSTDEFPAEYEPLLAHMNRYPKPTLSRVLAK